MSRLITTGIPPALTRALARQVRTWRQADPFGEVVVLVPDSRLAGILRDELPLEMHRASGAVAAVGEKKTGVFNVRIVTLTSWAREIARPRLLAEGRRLLPRYAALAVAAEAINRTKNLTTAFHPGGGADDPRDRPNFHCAVLTELINLKKAGRTPEVLRQKEGERFARELAAIYEASETLLREGSWADLSDIIAYAAQEVETREPLANAVGVALFGFMEVNALEERLIRALAAKPVDEAAFVPWVADTPAFALTTSLVEMLGDLWQTEPIAAKPECGEAVPARELVGDLFRTDRDAIHPGSVFSFASAPDRVQEWLDAARWVWQRMAEDRTLRFSDIHVIAPNLREVRTLARDMFAQAGIPLYEAQGTTLLESEAGRSLVQLLDTIDSGMTRSTVLELVTTCPLRAEWTESAKGTVPPTEWDRITRLAGIVGGVGAGRTVRSEWLDRLKRHAELLARRIEQHRPGFEEEGPQESREQMETDLAYTEALFRLIDALDDIRTTVARTTLTRTPRWEEWISAVREGWRRLFSFSPEEQQVRVQIEATLDEIGDYDGVAPLAPSGTRRRILSDALSEKSVPPEKRNEAGVWISDFAAAGYRRSRITIITGLADPEFPRTQPRSALTPFDIQKVEYHTTDRSIAIDRSIAEDYAHYAMALSAARERLRLSYPRREPGKDTQRLPSSAFLDTFKRIVEPLRDPAGQPLPWEERTLHTALIARGEWLLKQPIPEPKPEIVWLNEDEFDLAWAGRLRDTSRGERWVTALSRFSGPGLKLARARLAERVSSCDGWVDDPSLFGLFRKQVEPTHPISPSRLEAYATCPFRFFVQYVLRVQPLPEPTYELTLDSRTFGSLLHRFLARFFRRLRDEGALPLDSLPHEEYRRRFDEFAAHYRSEVAVRMDVPAPVVWNAQWETLCTRAWRAVEAALAEAALWEPRYMELGLGIAESSLEGGSSPEPITMKLADYGEVALRGVVDRVDFSRDGASARIIDYKSGRPPKKNAKAGYTDAGRRVQLLVYAHGLSEWLRRAEETRKVAQVGYHYLRNPVPESAQPGDKEWSLETLDAAALDAAIEELHRALGVVLDGIRRGAFPPVPEVVPNGRSASCRYCDVAPACGSLTDLAGRWRAFTQDERIAPLRSLRGGEEDDGESSS